jgi:hypothetical protein
MDIGPLTVETHARQEDVQYLMVQAHVPTASTMEVMPCITRTSPPLWVKDI